MCACSNGCAEFSLNCQSFSPGEKVLVLDYTVLHRAVYVHFNLYNHVLIHSLLSTRETQTNRSTSGQRQRHHVHPHAFNKNTHNTQEREEGRVRSSQMHTAAEADAQIHPVVDAIHFNYNVLHLFNRSTEETP